MEIKKARVRISQIDNHVLPSLHKTIDSIKSEQKARYEEQLSQGHHVLAERAMGHKSKDLASAEKGLETALAERKELEQRITEAQKFIESYERKKRERRAREISAQAEKLVERFRYLEGHVDLLMEFSQYADLLPELVQIIARYKDLEAEAALLREHDVTVDELPEQPVEPEGFRQAYEKVRAAFRQDLNSYSKRNPKIVRLEKDLRMRIMNEQAKDRLSARA
jgi:hypothetical protein